MLYAMVRFYVIAPFLFFSTAVLLPSCVNDPAKVKAFTITNTLPVQTANDVDLYYSDSARIKIHLTAPQVDEFAGANPYTEMIKGVKVDFYGDSGKVDSWLTSEYAIRKEREQIMEAKKHVVVVNASGERLETEHLIWDGNKRRIHTESFVTIHSGNQILTGYGLESDEMFTDYEIKHPKGTFEMHDQPDSAR